MHGRQKLVFHPIGFLRLREADALLLGSALSGQIMGDLGVPGVPSVVVVHDRDDDIRSKRGPVLATAPALVFGTTIAQGEREIPLALAEAYVLVSIEAREVLTYDLVGCIAGDPLGASVPRRDETARVDHADRIVAHAFRDEAEAFAGQMGRVRGLLARSLIHRHAGEYASSTALGQRARVVTHPSPLSLAVETLSGSRTRL